MYQLGWFSSGRDSAARELLRTVVESIENGSMKARINFVFSSRAPGESEESDRFLTLVEGYRIPLVYISYRDFKLDHAPTSPTPKGSLPAWRQDYDRRVMEQLKGYAPDISVLAGYMLVVGEEMCRRYDMINLHPAAPGGPKGTWQEVIWQLISMGATSSGVMMHLVTPSLDEGPAATYCTFPIRGTAFDARWKEIEDMSAERVKEEQGEANPLFRRIRAEGLKREFPLITATLGAFSRGKVRVENGAVVDDAGKSLKGGQDLTREIDALIKGER